MKKLSVLLLLIISAINVHAAGWTDPGKIALIAIEHRDAENDIYISLESAINTTCTRKDYLAIVADSEEKLARLYSTILAARVSNSDISFYASDDCDASGMSKSNLISF